MGPYRYHRIYLPITTSVYQLFLYTESDEFSDQISRPSIFKIIREKDDSTNFDISTGTFKQPNDINLDIPNTIVRKFSTAPLTPGYYWLFVDIYDGVLLSKVTESFEKNWKFVLSYKT